MKLFFVFFQIKSGRPIRMHLRDIILAVMLVLGLRSLPARRLKSLGIAALAPSADICHVLSNGIHVLQ